MARRQPPDREQAGAHDGASRAGRAERLATALPQVLDQLALLAAIRGDAAAQQLLIRAAAFARAHAIESEAHLSRVLEGQSPRASDDLSSLLRHLSDSAAWVLMESALADLPIDLRWLLESGTVSLEQLAVLHAGSGATSAADLAAAVANQTIRELPTFDAATEHAIEDALPRLRRRAARLPLGRAFALAEPLLERLRSLNGVAWACAGGSLRRGEDTVGDIELVAATTRPDDAAATVLAAPDVVRLLYKSPRRLYFRTEQVQVGVRLPDPAHAGATLLHVTGSIKHLAGLRGHAADAGWRLGENGLVGADGSLSPAATEEEIYATLKLPFIPPEIRGGDDELEAARRGSLPSLLTRGDIRGDLHMHTEFSDGRDTIEAMVAMCRQLGYQYMAITDHSPRSAASRNLSVESIERQADEIARLRERHPDITIFHGCEVDILPDGRLDFSDRILERLDIVLASLHEQAGSSRDELLRRYTAAMKHPLVTLITHPMNRYVPSRPGYDLDYDALFETAMDTGTIVEIDGAPAHLDMDGALARRAITAGVLVAVDSDSHRATQLDRQMTLGVTLARRGWVERRHVVNTRPLDEVRALIAAKRAP